MKKLVIVIGTLFLLPVFCLADTIDTNTEVAIESESGQNVVFRRNQRLRSNDGRSIYLYTNRTCELFDGDRLICTCTYRLQDGEVRLLDGNGNTVYKGSYQLKSDRQNLSSLTLSGTRYYAF